jgi:hypothetical protein
VLVEGYMSGQKPSYGLTCADGLIDVTVFKRLRSFMKRNEDNPRGISFP